MKPLTLQELHNALHDAIEGRYCCSAWVTQGNPLFVGFDEKEMTSSESSAERRCPYELEVWSSTWSVLRSGAMVASSSDVWEHAEAEVSRLVGLRADECRIDTDALGLSIEFESHVCLRVGPIWHSKHADADAWTLRLPDGLYRSVRVNGELYVVHETDPFPHTLDK